MRLLSSAPLFVLLSCSSSAPPAPVSTAVPPKAPANGVVTAATNGGGACADSMLLEAKLSVCEKLVREAGEQHHLTLLGFKSYLPSVKESARPTAEQIAGVWRSGFNPLAAERRPKGSILYEERIHYFTDGRVCGTQQYFDQVAGGMQKERTFLTVPFSGTWKMSGATLIEDYSKGTPPRELGKQVSRKRSITALQELSAESERRSIRFQTTWPSYFERVPAKKAASLREVNAGVETVSGELPADCFGEGLPSREKAEK